MDLALDLIERVPVPVLLGTSGAAVVLALLVAAISGGSVAVVALVVGALVVAISGGLLALRVHVNRLPLQLGGAGVLDRLDGHMAYRFRVRLGRGRSMDQARATVRFLPDGGEPVELEPLLGEARGLLGPWTVVVVDRLKRCESPGQFEVRVQAQEAGKTWSAEHSYRTGDLESGRFVSAVRPLELTLRAPEPWDAVRPPAGTDAR